MYRLFQQNKASKLDDLPYGGNFTSFSLFEELRASLVFRSFSIKFVLEGTERYVVNGREYVVESGQYLLANPACEEGTVLIDSKETVKGVCIDIAPALLSEALGNYLVPDAPAPDISIDRFFTGTDFPENKYRAKQTGLGAALTEIGDMFSRNPAGDFKLNNAFYFTLAEKIVEDHRAVLGQLYGIRTVKHETRKELYRRLCRGKEYLEENFAKNISILDAAKHAALSEYHFFRLFKAAFRVTPQQYLISVRLDHSLTLLRSGNHSISEIALATGYSDIFHFSQSFKKHFGVPPSSKALPKLAGFHKQTPLPYPSYLPHQLG